MTQTLDRSRALVPPLPSERLLAVVRGLGRDAATWRALAEHHRDERWHLRVSTNPVSTSG